MTDLAGRVAAGPVGSEPDSPPGILHVDMDAFYVSVELRRRPELRGAPVVVGGTGRRGVVAAASYEARVYGVRSAMSSVEAQRRCPHAVFLDGDHAHYAEVSAQVHQRLAEITDLVEPIALDEAFVDVRPALRRLGPASAIAAGLRRRLADELGLSASVGVAANRLLAKLASEAAKPRVDAAGPRRGRGVVLVERADELDFLHRHPVEALWGVGPVTLRRLRALGVNRVGQLAEVPLATLVTSLGTAHGHQLWELARGIDPRPVQAQREPVSVGREETFAHDRYRTAELDADLVRLADEVTSRLRGSGFRARTVQVKVRFADLRRVTRSHTLARPTDDARRVVDEARRLLEQLDLAAGVRLLGVSLSALDRAQSEQLSFDDLVGMPAASSDRALDRTVDDIRARFGSSAISRASAAGSRPVGPWGPHHGPSPQGARTEGGNTPSRRVVDEVGVWEDDHVPSGGEG